MLPNVFQSLPVVTYKHNKKIHRVWTKAVVIEADEEKIVAVTSSTVIIESNGRKWVSKEPAVCFYYLKRWYNIIAMIKKKGIFYYCNLASPSIYDGEAIKNIDYDLDVKLYPNDYLKILDEYEYQINSKKYKYSDDLKKVIESQMDLLIKDIRERKKPFDEVTIYNYYQNYQDNFSNKKNNL